MQRGAQFKNEVKTNYPNLYFEFNGNAMTAIKDFPIGGRQITYQATLLNRIDLGAGSPGPGPDPDLDCEVCQTALAAAQATLAQESRYHDPRV